MTTSEYVELAGLNFTCPKCGGTAIYTLRNDGDPVICMQCKNDLTNNEKLREHVALIKQMGAVFTGNIDK